MSILYSTTWDNSDGAKIRLKTKPCCMREGYWIEYTINGVEETVYVKSLSYSSNHVFFQCDEVNILLEVDEDDNSHVILSIDDDVYYELC